MAIIDGTEGPDRAAVRGTNDPDTIRGLGGNDTITGLLGLDWMDGGSGIDTVDYTYSDDGMEIDLLLARTRNLLDGGIERIFNFESVWGSQGNDRIFGTEGGNNLEGEDGGDSIFGRGGNDVLQGENGNDRLVGGNGNDRLIGGPGNDSLEGGAGSDQFVYRFTSESTGSAGDRIAGFDGVGRNPAGTVEDLVVLSEIDANTTLRGNQEFRFLGELSDAQGLLQGPGALWVHNDSDSSITFLHGNTDTDATIELTIRIADGTAITADDYWAGDFVL